MDLKTEVGNGDFRHFSLTNGQTLLGRLWLEARHPSYAARATAKNRAAYLQIDLPKGAAAGCALTLREAADYLTDLGAPTGEFWQAAHELGWPEAAKHLADQRQAAAPATPIVRDILAQAADLIARLDALEAEDVNDEAEVINVTTDLTLVLAELTHALNRLGRA